MDLRSRALMACASGAVLTWAAFAASNAFAADAPGAPPKPAAAAAADESAPAAEVVVTGTYIRGVAPVGSNLMSITKEDITAAGATDTAEILEETPQIFNIGISETSHGANGGSGNVTDGTSIDLRGIGFDSTVTIVDGHRVVPEGTAGQSIDPSTVPTMMLDRVEIIADGSSAVYGSDAIAGVVNLIMKRNVEGVDASARYGAGDHYNEYLVGLLAGHKWDTGQFTAAYEHGYHSNVNGADRSWYGSDLRSRGGADFLAQTCTPGTLTVNGAKYALPAGGVTPATAPALLTGANGAGTFNECDIFKAADLLPRQTHDSVAFTFDDTIGKVHFFADGMGTYRTYASKAATTNGTLLVTPASPYFVLPAGVVATSETVGYSFGGLLPTNDASGYSKSYNVTFGADYALPHDFKLTAQVGFGEDKDQNLASLGYTAAAGNAAVASGALNPFQPSTGLGSTSAAALLTTLTYMPGGSDEEVYDLKLDGPLFHLPGGDVKVAAGVEYRLDNAFIGTPPSSFANPNFRFFHRSITSEYGEIIVPLVGSDNAMPGIRGLVLDGQVRTDGYRDTSSYGNNSSYSTTNPKFGVNWTPIDSLKLRASWGTSFRAPIFSQIYGNSSQLFSQAIGSTQTIALSGPNFSLQPETSTTWTVGMDWQPTFLPGAKISLTYWDLNYKNQVANQLANTSTLLANAAQFAGTGIITTFTGAAITVPFGPNNGPINIPADTPQNQMNYLLAHIQCLQPSGLPGACAQTSFPTGAGFAPVNAVTFIDGRNKNLATTLAKGIDFDLSYRWSSENWGDFQARLAGTYFTQFSIGGTALSPLVNLLDVIGNPQRLRMRDSLTWHKGPYEAALFVNYTDGYTNNLPPSFHPALPIQNVSSLTTLDVHLGYTFNRDGSNEWSRDWKIGLDVSNLFDTAPPFVDQAPTSSGGGGWDPYSASPIGRVVSVAIDKKF